VSDTALDAFDFLLPQENIAQFPADRRENSRLMVLSGSTNEPEDRIFHELPEILRAGDLLVRNNTKVIPARLPGKLPGGGKAEALLMHPAASHPGLETQLPENTICWVCLAKPGNKLKPGKILTFADGKLQGEVISKLGEGQVIMAFDVVSEHDFMQIVEENGELPLPPYIQRDEVSTDDKQRYQTTFARHTGAVAAPTAGLHFTPEVDLKLVENGIEITHLTLHVGPGTFRPIKVDDITEHQMDGEYYEVPEDCAKTINAARKEGRRIITVGSTSTRTIETVTDENGVTHSSSGWSKLFIRPGYKWKAIDGMLTNFHLPKSSLIVMVSALMGRERIMHAYNHAIKTGYRFYSYGDAMLLLP